MPIIITASVSPKTIFSSHPFQDPQGNVLANGYLTLDLNTMAIVTGLGGQVVPLRVNIPLDANGLIVANTVIWGNDQLSPPNTFYSVRVFNSNNSAVGGPIIWFVVGGSPIDVSTLPNVTPTATNPNAVLQNPNGSQTVLNFPLSVENNILLNRTYINQGSPLVSGDFALSGWGSGATFTFAGTDAMFTITVTAGTTPSVAPTITLTYHDGSWGTNAPMPFGDIVSGTGADADVDITTTNTAIVITYEGLPVATDTYTFVIQSIGH